MNTDSTRTGVADGAQNPNAPAVSPARWLAFLRIVVGAWFLKSVITKFGFTLVWGFIPLPGATARWVGFMPVRVAEYASENPIGPWQGFSYFLSTFWISPSPARRPAASGGWMAYWRGGGPATPA